MIKLFYNKPISKVFLGAFLLFLSLSSSNVAAKCDAPEPACQWRNKIVGIKTPNMIATGIRLANGLILTNRHVVEDHQIVLIRNADGSIEQAEILPHDIPVDLAIVSSEANENTSKDFKKILETKSQTLFVVAFDQGRNGARVYGNSSFANYPDGYNYLQARIHSDAKALPGNSGGAVVDQNGGFVGVLASGDNRISEIIPAVHVKRVIESLDQKHRGEFFRIGKLIRLCADALYFSSSIVKDPPEPIISKIDRNCFASGNKQLLDQAGQTFGRWWMFDLSEKFLAKSEKLDPWSPNTLMSLAVTHHLSRRPEKVVSVIKRYLQIDPANPQALRLGVQNAGMLGDKIFAERLLELLKEHNPSALPMARSYLENAFSN